MDTTTQKGRDMRKAQLERKEVERLTKRYRKTKEAWIINHLWTMYGIGDPDISENGILNRG
jgi:hypothetical protein